MRPMVGRADARRTALPRTLAALALAALALACQRDQVVHFRVPKETQPVMAAIATPSAGAAADQGGLRWTLPAGWKDAPGGGDMRYATLTAPGQGNLDITVTRLSGPAGGELANVNRWRSQIGLPPMAEADLAPARKVVKSPAGDLAVYDFASGKSRTIAGLVSIEGETWFLKMKGDADAVASARPAFLQILGSVHLEPR
jgi:hypothetical protein